MYETSTRYNRSKNVFNVGIGPPPGVVFPVKPWRKVSITGLGHASFVACTASWWNLNKNTQVTKRVDKTKQQREILLVHQSSQSRTIVQHKKEPPLDYLPSGSVAKQVIAELDCHGGLAIHVHQELFTTVCNHCNLYRYTVYITLILLKFETSIVIRVENSQQVMISLSCSLASETTFSCRWLGSGISPRDQDEPLGVDRSFLASLC